MDIAASTSVTVLPASGVRRRWFARRPGAPLVPEAAATSDVTVLEAVPSTAHSDHQAPASDFAPLAAFGRWMADFDSSDPGSDARVNGNVSAPEAVTVPAPSTAYSSSMTTEPATVTTHAMAPSYEPSAPRPDQSDKIAELTRDLRDLTEELETVRQRNAAERMNLLEQLASARDARRAAETELAAVQAILDAAERRLPAPRRSHQLHAVS